MLYAIVAVLVIIADQWVKFGVQSNVALLDGAFDVGAEEEVPATNLLHHVDQTGLVDRDAVVFGIPCRNPLGVDVNDDDLPVGIHLGDDRHRRPADVPRSYADYIPIHLVPFR